MHFHFLFNICQLSIHPSSSLSTYHFEIVELLLDLLSQHGCEPVAGRDLSTPIVLLARPSIVEHDSGGESGVPLGTAVGRAGVALRVMSKPQSANKVVFVS